MLLLVLHALWSIIDDSGFVVSPVMSSASASFSFQVLTGKMGTCPLVKEWSLTRYPYTDYLCKEYPVDEWSVKEWPSHRYLQPVSYDFALISESYSTHKHHRVCYDNSLPSSSSISSRQYRSSSVCTSAMAAWQVAGVTLLKPSATCARSPFVV